MVVDFDEVARRVANVELDDVAGQLDEVVPKGGLVEGVSPLGGAVDRLNVIDGDPKVMVARRLEVALEEVQLRAPKRKPLHWDAEVRSIDALRAQEVLIEANRLLQIERVDADVVDLGQFVAPLRRAGMLRTRFFPARGETMAEIVVVGAFTAKPGKEEDAKHAFARLIEPTHNEPGCILYALHRGADDPARLAFIERWATREDLDAHLKSDHVADVLRRADELFETSDITVYNPLPGGEPTKGSLAEHASSAA